MKTAKTSLVFILVLVVMFTMFQPSFAVEIDDDVGDEIIPE